MTVRCAFEVIQVTDTRIILVDLDNDELACTVTNDADNVVAWLDRELKGIGKRRVYYRDSAGRFDELCTQDGRFTGFSPCTDGQQTQLAAALV